MVFRTACPPGHAHTCEGEVAAAANVVRTTYDNLQPTSTDLLPCVYYGAPLCYCHVHSSAPLCYCHVHSGAPLCYCG